MAQQNESAAEKTEEATPKRLREAKEKGNVLFSREVTNFFMLLLMTFFVVWLGPWMMRQTTLTFADFVTKPHEFEVTQGGIQIFSEGIVVGIFTIFAVFALLTIFVAVVASAIQHGFVFSPEPIMPKLSKISPISGFKRLFSMKSLMEFLKGVIKIILVAVASWIAIAPELNRMDMVTQYDPASLLLLLDTLAFRVLIACSIVMAAVALLDYLYQRWEYLKSLRMTKQEVKEEFKQTEGDPMVKNRLRQIRMERARERMMASLPQADVVITNPTHFAVALEYDEATMQAPLVTVKGQDHVALNIRRLAEEMEIPIVENPPLARALYQSSEIGEEVPVEHYQTVAEVISYVYRLKGKMPEKKQAA